MHLPHESKEVFGELMEGTSAIKNKICRDGKAYRLRVACPQEVVCSSDGSQRGV